jgi:hypothetical protein
MRVHQLRVAYIYMYICMCVCVCCVCVSFVCVCVYVRICAPRAASILQRAVQEHNISYKQLASEGSCGKTQENTFCNTRNKNATKKNVPTLAFVLVSFYLSFHSMYNPQHWRIGRDLNTRAQTQEKWSPLNRQGLATLLLFFPRV